MNFENCWEKSMVSPKTIRAVEQMRREQTSETVTDADFYQSCFDKINEEIAKMENEGKAICYTNYAIPYFIVADTSVAFGSHSILWRSDTAIAIAQNVLEYIKAEHEYSCAIYQGYDDFKERFEELRSRVMFLGGKLTLERPVFVVELPTDRDALTYDEYKLHGCKRDYEALRRRISYLGNHEPASAKITTD